MKNKNKRPKFKGMKIVKSIIRTMDTKYVRRHPEICVSGDALQQLIMGFRRLWKKK